MLTSSAVSYRFRRTERIRMMPNSSPDWALDAAFVQHNEDICVWLKQLPADLQIHYPDDGRPPQIRGDHFVAYIHIYHHLVVVMHHRPQLQAMLEKRDPDFKKHLTICLHSAMMMCRVQEALLREFGLHGLHFMQRGINFTIYCILTCTMLHLVSNLLSSLRSSRLTMFEAAITSPDPLLNSQARLFFTRHMRILEHCIVSASSEMQMQINALREAFSLDTQKPFELKPTLGLQSPILEDHPTPPELRHAPYSVPTHSISTWTRTQDSLSSTTMSPASEHVLPFDPTLTHSIPAQTPIQYDTGNYGTTPGSSYGTQTSQQATSTPQTSSYALEQISGTDQQATSVWDPSGLFQQWNSVFGAPQHHASSPQARLPAPASSTTPLIPTHAGDPAFYAAAQHQSPVAPIPLAAESVPVIPTVTPVMWQNAFTNAYVSGLPGHKRLRQEEGQSGVYGWTSKRRG